MTLREGVIPTLFQGVSRQPDSVRFVGQVEDAENVDFSVETGGFSPRLGLRLKKKITGLLATGDARRLHPINRDASEKYRMIISNGGIKVFDADYVEKTVNIDAAGLTWLADDPENFAVLTALDYTFIVKKSDVVAMAADVAPDAPSDAVLYVNTLNGNQYQVTINGVSQALYIGAGDTAFVATQLTTQLSTNLGAGWTVNRVGSWIFIRKNDGTSFTIRQRSPEGDTYMNLWHGPLKSGDDAPAQARHGTMFHVLPPGIDTEGYWIKFAADDGSYGTGIWQETVAPGDLIAFDEETMPRALVRNMDGSFTLQTLDWSNKTAGNDEDMPPPDFVGDSINDIVFARNRLGFLSSETAYFSQAGDTFNFWPASAIQTLDSDPLGLTNTTNSVSKFYFGVPFRRSVFVMADSAQFEISGDTFTSTRASIDLATSYRASTRCRPVAVGDELYFPAEVGSFASLLSYVYDQDAVSETANDVTKHVPNFIPAPIVELAAEPIEGKVFLRSESDTDALYVHTFFYQGNERVQSAWARYVFAGMNVLSIGMLDGVLNLLVEYDGAVWLAEVPLKADIYDDFAWVPRLDFNQLLTGTYDAGDDTTTWDLGYAPTNPAAFTSMLFDDGMFQLSLTIDGNTVIADGDWSAHPVMIGEQFDSYVDFSKQYLRDEKGASVIAGRLVIKAMTLNYANSGYFETTVTAEGRADKVKKFNARFIGDTDNTVQSIPIADTGSFRFGVNSNAKTVSIRVGSTKPLPYTIVSAAWVGDFTQLAA